MSMSETVTYVDYYLHVGFFTEHDARNVSTRDPVAAAEAAPEYAFAFKFYDVKTVYSDGEKLTGQPKNKSAVYYIDAEQLTASQIEQRLRVGLLPGSRKTYDILLGNMRANEYKKVWRCRTFNWQPVSEGDLPVTAQGAEFPIVCDNGCPEGWRGSHKFSCVYAQPEYIAEAAVKMSEEERRDGIEQSGY